MNDSKLKPFAATLLEMRQEGKKLSEMVKWLREEKDITIGRSTVGDFVLQLEQEEEEKVVFAQIASGGRMNKELDKAYRENPAPEIERLITMTKTLIMTLQVKAAGANGCCDMKLLNTANAMQQTVLNFISGQTKANLDQQKISIADRRTKLMEKKAEAFDAAKKVSSSKLSAEEKEAEYRRIFGMT